MNEALITCDDDPRPGRTRRKTRSLKRRWVISWQLIDPPDDTKLVWTNNWVQRYRKEKSAREAIEAWENGKGLIALIKSPKKFKAVLTYD